MLDYAYSEPETAAEMLDRYARIRRKTYGRAPFRAATPKVIVRIETLIDHNAHVVTWRNRGRSTPSMIVAEEAVRAGITPHELRNGGRKPKFAKPRQRAAIRIYVEHPHLSLSKISRVVGWKDHTTIITYIQAAGVWRNPGRRGARNGD